MNATAALAHLACVWLGPPAYRFMGAGERLARAAQAKRIWPAVLTMAIAAVLLVWAGLALSAAGLIAPCPYARPLLLVVTMIYGGRVVVFPWLRSAFPENSERFWRVSSGLCALMACVHGAALWAG